MIIHLHPPVYNSPRHCPPFHKWLPHRTVDGRGAIRSGWRPTSGTSSQNCSTGKPFANHSDKANPPPLQRSHPSVQKSSTSIYEPGVNLVHLHRPNATAFAPLCAATQRAPWILVMMQTLSDGTLKPSPGRQDLGRLSLQSWSVQVFSSRNFGFVNRPWTRAPPSSGRFPSSQCAHRGNVRSHATQP